MIEQPRNQRTIASPVAVEGFGYWSGRDVRVEFRPAPADAGITFVRSDLDPAVHVPATIHHRLETPRRTTVAAGGVRVEMVEHILAALSGLAIDNCQIWVDQAEMPGMDGSAAAFVEALDRVGVVEQDAPREELVIRQPTRLGDNNRWIEARPTHGERKLSLTYYLDYGEGNAIGCQSIRLDVTRDAFRSKIAPCRTFLLKQEADTLLAQNMGQRVTAQDLLVFDDRGPIDNQLRFDDECVRHKVLDLLGDLALAGCDVVGEIVAFRCGHRLHAQLVAALTTTTVVQPSWKRSA